MIKLLTIYPQVLESLCIIDETTCGHDLQHNPLQHHLVSSISSTFTFISSLYYLVRILFLCATQSGTIAHAFIIFLIPSSIFFSDFLVYSLLTLHRRNQYFCDLIVRCSIRSIPSSSRQWSFGLSVFFPTSNCLRISHASLFLSVIDAFSFVAFVITEFRCSHCVCTTSQRCSIKFAHQDFDDRLRIRFCSNR